MNLILLGSACLGVLAVFLTSDPQIVAEAKAELGSMTHDVNINPKTGEVEETNVIAFLDP